MRTESDGITPAVIDVDRPSSARIYDYVLGGKDNYEVDRCGAEQVMAAFPTGRTAARHSRLFM